MKMSEDDVASIVLDSFSQLRKFLSDAKNLEEDLKEESQKKTLLQKSKEFVDQLCKLTDKFKASFYDKYNKIDNGCIDELEGDIDLSTTNNPENKKHGDSSGNDTIELSASETSKDISEDSSAVNPQNDVETSDNEDANDNEDPNKNEIEETKNDDSEDLEIKPTPSLNKSIIRLVDLNKLIDPKQKKSVKFDSSVIILTSSDDESVNVSPKVDKENGLKSALKSSSQKRFTTSNDKSRNEIDENDSSENSRKSSRLKSIQTKKECNREVLKKIFKRSSDRNFEIVSKKSKSSIDSRKEKHKHKDSSNKIEILSDSSDNEKKSSSRSNKSRKLKLNLDSKFESKVYVPLPLIQCDKLKEAYLRNKSLFACTRAARSIKKNKRPTCDDSDSDGTQKKKSKRTEIQIEEKSSNLDTSSKKDLVVNYDKIDSDKEMDIPNVSENEEKDQHKNEDNTDKNKEREKRTTKTKETDDKSISDNEEDPKEKNEVIDKNKENDTQEEEPEKLEEVQKELTKSKDMDNNSSDLEDKDGAQSEEKGEKNKSTMQKKTEHGESADNKNSDLEDKDSEVSEKKEKAKKDKSTDKDGEVSERKEKAKKDKSDKDNEVSEKKEKGKKDKSIDKDSEVSDRKDSGKKDKSTVNTNNSESEEDSKRDKSKKDGKDDDDDSKSSRKNEKESNKSDSEEDVGKKDRNKKETKSSRKNEKESDKSDSEEDVGKKDRNKKETKTSRKNEKESDKSDSEEEVGKKLDRNKKETKSSRKNEKESDKSDSEEDVGKKDRNKKETKSSKKNGKESDKSDSEEDTGKKADKNKKETKSSRKNEKESDKSDSEEDVGKKGDRNKKETKSSRKNEKESDKSDSEEDGGKKGDRNKKETKSSRKNEEESDKSDSEEDVGKKGDKNKKETVKKPKTSKKPVLSDSDESEENYKAKLDCSSDDEKGSDNEKDEKKTKKLKKRAKKIVLSDSDDDDDKKDDAEKSDSSSNSSNSEKESNSENEEQEKKSKKKSRIKKSRNSSSESEEEVKTRKQIRRVLDKDSLSETTKQAESEEKERKARIAEKQKKYNRIFEEKKDAVVESVVLDYDSKTKEPLISVHKGIVKNLKPHQVSGINFMYDACFESLERSQKSTGSGCILAHCMGLGKTLQVISLSHTLLTHSKKTKVQKVMVVCPINTVLNWKAEFKKWVPRKAEIEVHELATSKKNYERQYIVKEWHEDGGVLIIGYHMFRNLSNPANKRLTKKMRTTFQEGLIDPGPDLVICDEGHLLKNEKTHLSIAMNRIKSARRIVLTGTPLQNNLKEYWCMVQFIKPNLLGTYKEYMNRFVNPITNGQYTDSTQHDTVLMRKRSHVLHKLLDGVVQRRDYSVLEPYLPPKYEYVLFVKLSETQIKLYKHYMEKYARRSDGSNRTSFLFTDFQNFQRIGTHPRVFLDKTKEKKDKYDDDEEESEGSLKDFIDDGDESSSKSSSSNESGSDESGDENKTSKSKSRGRVTRAAAAQRKENNEDSDIEEIVAEVKKEWWQEYCDGEELDNINNSGKLSLLFDLLKECEEIGDKILVFSQSLYTLNCIEYFLNKVDEATQIGDTEKVCEYKGTWELGLDYFRIDGSSSCDNRAYWCDSFNNPENTRARLFLISTKAGGLGINLVAANRVVIFDVSWNPSHDIQSIYRVYRFGQNKPCYVYRFVTYGAMEMKIYERQVTKQAISKRVIDEQQIDRHYNQNDLQELYKCDLEPTDRPIPLVPKDVLLAEMLQKYEKIIYQYHLHQSLLENKTDEGLNEEERKSAWEEFENEKVLRKTYNTTASYFPGSNNMSAQAINAALTNIVRRDNPHWTDMQIKGIIPALVRQLQIQIEENDMSMYQRVVQEIQIMNQAKMKESYYQQQMMKYYQQQMLIQKQQQSVMGNLSITPQILQSLFGGTGNVANGSSQVYGIGPSTSTQSRTSNDVIELND